MYIKVIAIGSTRWDRFIRRWGVSFLIGQDLLFDTFADPYVFLNNIRSMSIDISKIKHIIISHDDWDHISGLWYIINKYKNINVYFCPNFKLEIKQRIRSFGVNVVEAGSLLKIKDGIYTTGQLYGESKGKNVYEQSLIVKSSNGLIIITGCAHPGIINIVDNVKRQFNENIYLVLGGLHLKDSTEGQINSVIAKLILSGVSKIAPCHCTGRLATRLIDKEYKDNFIQVKQGSIIEV